MSETHDRDYHAKRATDERRLSETATDPKIAALHQQLAELYEKLIGPEDSDPEPLIG